ncbi:MAG: phytanoyl-CoA dioxygenase family protein [bacterium]|nr:phytanoyl-CoA dioxygenase family protein [bacterium]
MTDPQRIDFEARGYLSLTMNADILTQIQAAFDRSKDHLDDLPNRDDVFITLAEHPDIFPFVHAILSDDIQLRSITGFTAAPRSSGRGWHRETASIQGVNHTRSTLCVEAYIQLDDTPPGGANLMAVPTSYRFESDLPAIARIQDMPHAVALPGQAGSVALLHGNLWQARTRNQSHVSQRFLKLSFVHCWMRQALPVLSAHASDLIGASKNLSQLFGLRDVANAQGYWSGQLETHSSETGIPDRKFSSLKVVGKGSAPNA